MAGRIMNRRALRKQADQADQAPSPEAAAVDPASAEARPSKRKAKAKTPAAPRARKPRAPKLPPRMRARWGVFDSAMKQVAIFDYNQRAAAEEKVADFQARKKGAHFLQIVKEAMPEPAAAAAPAAK